MWRELFTERFWPYVETFESPFLRLENGDKNTCIPEFYRSNVCKITVGQNRHLLETSNSSAFCFVVHIGPCWLIVSPVFRVHKLNNFNYLKCSWGAARKLKEPIGNQRTSPQIIAPHYGKTSEGSLTANWPLDIIIRRLLMSFAKVGRVKNTRM